MTWTPFNPWPEEPTTLVSLRAGRVLLQVQAYAFGQRRVQVAIDFGSGFLGGIMAPEL